MRILISLVLLLFFVNIGVQAQSDADLVDFCSMGAGDDATYLKDFLVKLEAGAPNERPPQQKFTLVLSKNTLYRFSVCNAEDSDGKGVIQLFDTNRLLGSTYVAATGKEYPYFDFKCTKTGVYHVFIYFQGGKSGRAVGILSFIRKI